MDEAYQLATCIVGWWAEALKIVGRTIWFLVDTYRHATIPGIPLKEPAFHVMRKQCIFDGSGLWISHPWSKKKWLALLRCCCSCCFFLILLLFLSGILFFNGHLSCSAYFDEFIEFFGFSDSSLSFSLLPCPGVLKA